LCVVAIVAHIALVSTVLAEPPQVTGVPGEAVGREFGQLAAALAGSKWETPEARKIVLDVAIRLDIPQAASVLRQFVDDSDATVRNRAILALVNCRSPSAVSILVGLLNNNNADIRVSAVLGLQKMQTAEAAKHLLTALKDKNPGTKGDKRGQEPFPAINARPPNGSEKVPDPFFLPFFLPFFSCTALRLYVPFAPLRRRNVDTAGQVSI
jgi:hypothetical protein